MVLNSPGFACVYWIHLPSHKNYLAEGYIGVSSNPSRRWKEHKRDAKGNYHPNNYLGNAINKYQDDLIYEVIFAGTTEQCYIYEQELRPKPSIGWNLMSGGPTGKITEEGRERLSKARKGKSPSLMTKWKSYKTRYGYISLSDYKDYLAIKNGELPPSKKDLEIFCPLDASIYANAEELAKELDNLTAMEILDICDTKEGDYIYLKDI